MGGITLGGIKCWSVYRQKQLVDGLGKKKLAARKIKTDRNARIEAEKKDLSICKKLVRFYTGPPLLRHV